MPPGLANELRPMPSRSAPDLHPPIEIASNSYLALSRHIQPGGLDESSPGVDGVRPAHPAEDALPIVPVRVRDARGLLDF